MSIADKMLRAKQDLDDAYAAGYVKRQNETAQKIIDRSITEIDIPDGVVTIGHSAFAQCKNLIRVNMPDSVNRINANAFTYCDALSDLRFSNNLEVIISGAFIGCSSLETLVFPKSMCYIQASFSNCTNLKTVIFLGTLRSDGLYNSTFNNCPNLTDIYVPWEEVAVKLAPWGATNATIHYNYTGE